MLFSLVDLALRLELNLDAANNVRARREKRGKNKKFLIKTQKKKNPYVPRSGPKAPRIRFDRVTSVFDVFLTNVIIHRRPNECDQKSVERKKSREKHLIVLVYEWGVNLTFSPGAGFPNSTSGVPDQSARTYVQTRARVRESDLSY
jgi:hypothetical protein